ncbi:D-alanine--poly(phosphoribitol) ligase [Streptomyces sp. SB3404]|uniref:D-alanine--poly(Phosphoribitol) ligase n=1 Tax=Streptomyces boncukensis TaxID=2711219 RepID=A0A6G4WTT1_9ACTN|nr:D-alanine--poly(phosphoribitol) ligase [Streptomyces boncukensis]
MENLRGFLLRAAKTTPEKPALVERSADGGLSTLTYRQLEDRVDAYAADLDKLGLDTGDRVVLESDVTGCAVAMLLACATLGLPFIPVSPETPAKRLAAVLDAAEPALFARAAGAARAAAPEDTAGIPESVGLVHFDPDGVHTRRPPLPRARHRRRVVSTDTAYIIFTSGTTGRPKGVVMSHRAVVSLLSALLTEELLTPDDRVATTSPLQFDFALFDIGFALGSGATLVPVPRAELTWPRHFLAFLDEAAVTHVDGVPSIWRPVLRHEPERLAELSGLRGILFTGEDFPLPELRRLQRLLPGVRITNGYGATESMACSFTEVPSPLPDDLERLSIGFPLPGYDITLIGADGRPVEEAGAEGQIHLRAPSLFTGYWDDPEATRAALVPDPLDPRSGRQVLRSGDLACRGEGGELYFLGRADSQVQIRGHRVELREVERRLLELPGVSAAVALLVPQEGQDPRLLAFVVPGREGGTEFDAEFDAEFDKAEARAFCAETLPGYMIPQDIRAVDDIPLTANGKADRAALAARAATPSGP